VPAGETGSQIWTSKAECETFLVGITYARSQFWRFLFLLAGTIQTLLDVIEAPAAAIIRQCRKAVASVPVMVQFISREKDRRPTPLCQKVDHPGDGVFYTQNRLMNGIWTYEKEKEVTDPDNSSAKLAVNITISATPHYDSMQPMQNRDWTHDRQNRFKRLELVRPPAIAQIPLDLRLQVLPALPSLRIIRLLRKGRLSTFEDLCSDGHSSKPAAAKSIPTLWRIMSRAAMVSSDASRVRCGVSLSPETMRRATSAAS
jgi:hypothetical protein